MKNATATALNFITADTRICVDISFVEKILPLMLINKIPNSPPYVAGLMNVNDECIPTIDLAMKLGINTKTKYTLNESIILCVNEKHKIGLIVDKTLGLIEINEPSVQLNQDFKINDFFIGTIINESETVFILNIKNILSENILLKA